jgi:ParB-like chromosome segregation protein Spo0J
MQNIQTVKLSEVKPNPTNPRFIKDEKFKKLVQSIKEFPQMLHIRPIVVNADMIVLGGNMRLKACQEAGLKEIPIIQANDLTEQQQKEFIIKDNVGFGEWDWDNLANEWDTEELAEWGLDVPVYNQDHDSIEPSGYDTTTQWFLNISFDSEEECQEWYDKLISEGLICKIVQ